MGYLPIGDHGIIGNLHTAALVGVDGTIDWLCLPAFDSPSVFCSILDDEKGGHFRIRPDEYERSQQLYLPDSNVLLTRFLSRGGMAEVIDYMPILAGPGDRSPAGAHARAVRGRAGVTGSMPILAGPGARSRLVRHVRVVRGSMPFEVECRPAFDYARG